MNGRISALLELGAGFHPELTGRENFFMNGAILGLTKKEITDKFSDIVEFAGLEEFIDTPVKNYSSGMFVRFDVHQYKAYDLGTVHIPAEWTISGTRGVMQGS